MRDLPPAPMLSRYAVFSSMPQTARKSRSSAPGTCAARQVTPPSVVRRKAPPVPLAQTILALTALTPRREALVPLVWRVQDCAARAAGRRRASASFIWLHGTADKNRLV